MRNNERTGHCSHIMNISINSFAQTNLRLDILLDNSNFIQHPEIKNNVSVSYWAILGPLRILYFA